MKPEAERGGSRSGLGAGAVVVEAPAKINLSLRILRRRDDGYHELDTLFQAISLADEVRLVPRDAPGIGLTVVGADVGPVEDNLALRAARAWAGASGVDPRVHIRLTKRIPAGAGLGGGSSDAGAVLRGLEAIHGAPLGFDGIAEVGATLGADVAFFCGEAALARGRGIGECLDPLPALPPRELIVVVPPVAVPTAEAYAWLAAARTGSASEGRGLDSVAASPTWDRVEGVAENDFHEVVAGRVPEVAEVVRRMEAAGLEGVLLSGSGSAVFGFPPTASGSAAAADVAAGGLRAALGEARVFRAATLASMPSPRRGDGRP